MSEFVVSVYTGMRLSEQYSCMWSQVDLERRTIDLTKTKNESPRTAHLNADASTAIRSLKRPPQKASDPVFPREGSQGRFDTRSWFQPCLEAKIANYVWHSNRHTFCSWLAMAGASIREIQEFAGHRKIIISDYSLNYLLFHGKLHTRRIGSRVLIPISELQRYARTDHKRLAN